MTMIDIDVLINTIIRKTKLVDISKEDEKIIDEILVFGISGVIEKVKEYEKNENPI